MTEPTDFPMLTDAHYEEILADLTPKQRLFLAYYWHGLSVAEAVRAADLGNETDARATGLRLLKRRHIQAALLRLFTYHSEQNALTITQVTMLLRAQAYHDPADIYEDGGATWKLKPLEEWPLESRLSLQQVSVRETVTEHGVTRTTLVKFSDRQHAAELLGKSLHMFDVKGTNGQFNLVVQMDSPKDAEPKTVKTIEGIGLSIELPHS